MKAPFTNNPLRNTTDQFYRPKNNRVNEFSSELAESKNAPGTGHSDETKTQRNFYSLTLTDRWYCFNWTAKMRTPISNPTSAK
jgi:hypothetical protein